MAERIVWYTCQNCHRHIRYTAGGDYLVHRHTGVSQCPVTRAVIDPRVAESHELVSDVLGR